MNKNRFYILIVLALLGAMLLVACGSGASEEAPASEGAPAEEAAPAEEEAAAEEEAPAEEEAAEEDMEMASSGVEGCDIVPPSEETEINMIGWSFPITDFYAEELMKCDAVENLTVNTNLLASADAQEQVRLALAAGGDSPFDIIHFANAQVGEWAGPGWLMPLNDLVDQYRDEYNLDDIPEKAWEGVTIDGNIYGVPIVGNTLHLIYRQDVFDELGLEVPETYDEVIEMCNSIGLDNPDWDMPFTVNLSAGWAWEIEFFQMQRAFGGKFLDENNMPTFNDETGVAAVEKLVEVADACMGVDGYTFDINDQEVAVQLGTLPATNMWASRAANSISSFARAFFI